MDDCPKCGSPLKFSPQGSATVVWACASWQNEEKGISFEQSCICRVRELEQEVELLRKQNEQLQAQLACHQKQMAELRKENIELRRERKR